MYYDIFILGSLLERPHYGYEIKKRLTDSFQSCFSISNNTLYPVLKKFQDAGATRKTVETVEGKPSRIVYHITDEGRRLFVQQLRHFPESLFQSRNDVSMRLVYFHYLDHATRVRLLDGRQAFLVEPLAHLAIRRETAPYPDIIDFHSNILQAECDVIEKFRKRLDDPCLIDEDGHATKEAATMGV